MTHTLGIGAYRRKAYETQVEQAGKAHQNIQAQTQHHINQHQGGNVDLRTASGKWPDQCNGDQQEDKPPSHRFGEHWQAAFFTGRLEYPTERGPDHLEDENYGHTDRKSTRLNSSP